MINDLFERDVQEWMRDDSVRMEALDFRMNILYPSMKTTHESESISIDPVIMESLITKSRRIEDTIGLLYTAIAFDDSHTGFPVTDSVAKKVLSYLYGVWKGHTPCWVQDCLRLGSYVPVIDNVERVVKSINDTQVFVYLRSVRHPLRYQ